MTKLPREPKKRRTMPKVERERRSVHMEAKLFRTLGLLRASRQFEDRSTLAERLTHELARNGFVLALEWQSGAAQGPFSTARCFTVYGPDEEPLTKVIFHEMPGSKPTFEVYVQQPTAAPNALIARFWAIIAERLA